METESQSQNHNLGSSVDDPIKSPGSEKAVEETTHKDINESNAQNSDDELSKQHHEEKVDEESKEKDSGDVKENKGKIKEKEKDSKYSSDDNSDGELKKHQIRRRPGASGLSAKPKVKNLRRNNNNNKK